MFIDPNYSFQLEIKNPGRLKLLHEVLDPSLKMGDSVNVPWYFLKTSSLRSNHLKLKCDDCGNVFSKKLCNLDPSNNIHYCGSCFQKGERHYNFGGSIHKNSKIGIINWHDNNENPARRAGVRKKISKARKGKPSNMLGKNQSEETKRKISDSNKITMKKMWETGKLNYKSKYADSKIEEYKGIQYQGNYELDFLKEMEKYGLLSLIERGPVIEYMDSAGKNRLYLVDFKIKNTDLLIEIKSSYTIKINSKNNHLKFEFAKKHGNFIIIIDKDYSDLRKKINEYGISKF